MLKCKKCTKPEDRPISYKLDKCDVCGVVTGVAEVEYRPQSVDDIFQCFKKEA